MPSGVVTCQIAGHPGNDVVPDLIGHLVQKHSETARDTIKMKGIASGFPIEMHLMQLRSSNGFRSQSLRFHHANNYLISNSFIGSTGARTLFTCHV